MCRRYIKISCYDSDSDTEEPNSYALASPTTTADYTAHSSPILPSPQSPDVNQIHQREMSVVPDISLLQESNLQQTIPTPDIEVLYTPDMPIFQLIYNRPWAKNGNPPPP